MITGIDYMHHGEFPDGSDMHRSLAVRESGPWGGDDDSQLAR